MGYLVVGLSHRTAPMAVIGSAALSPSEAEKLVLDLAAADDVDEAAVLATCNRLEVYADVSRFHGGIERVSELIAARTDLSIDALAEHLYVLYDEAAVRHVFSVTSGLDSMVVGESQILGQVRGALRAAQDAGSAGRAVNLLLQHALRVGKRVQTETDLGRAGRSLVSVGLSRVDDRVGGLAGRHALVVGAGTIGALAARTLRRLDVADLVVANRTPERALALAASVSGRAVPWAGLEAAIAAADVVVTCTGAADYVVSARLLRAAMAQRTDHELVVLDLAVPRDTDPAGAEIPGVVIVTIDGIAARITAPTAGLEAAQALVDEEVAAFGAIQRASGAGSTVVALRAMAADVVALELARLRARLDDAPPAMIDEFARTLDRVVDKLLHTPTVRVKELGAESVGTDYVTALRELFALDPRVIDVVTQTPPGRVEPDRS